MKISTMKSGVDEFAGKEKVTLSKTYFFALSSNLPSQLEVSLKCLFKRTGWLNIHSFGSSYYPKTF